MNNLTFAFSTSTVTNSKSNNQAITFSEMVDIIKNSSAPAFYNSIASTTINGLYDGTDVKQIKKVISPLKMKLPFFLFSGYQAVGHNNKSIDYNGCVQIDIDFKEIYGEQMAQEAKSSLSKLPYIALAGISPSGVGVKALVQTNSLDKQNHIALLNQVIDTIVADTNINKSYFDSVGASQPVFCFYDSDLYVNYNASKFTHKPFKVAKVRVAKTVKLNAPTGNLNATVLTDSQVEKGLQIAYNCSVKRRGQIVDTTFLQTYCGITLKFGISASKAFNFLLDQGHGSDLTNKRQNSFYDLYDRYSSSFGTADIAYDIQDIVSTDQLDYTLTATQKLSDIDLDLSKNSIVVSPTSSGKSYYIGNKLTTNRVMVVPTQALVKQFANEYNASPFYADEKELSNPNFIVTTYKSFSNLCNLINPQDYTLFIDEAHSFTSSSSYNFLLKELNQVIDLVHVFKAYHLLTATPLFSFHKSINTLRVLKVTKPMTYTKNVYDLRYTDLYKTLNTQVQNTVANDGQFVILSNNTKETGRLGRIKGALSKFNIVTINSTKKDQQSFIEVAIDGDMSKCQGIISTSIIKEGNSITKHSDLVNVFIDGNFHPAELEQFSARFRNVKTLNLYIMKSEKMYDSFCNFNLDTACEELLELVDTHKNYADSIKSSAFATREQLTLLANIDKSYFKHVGDDIDVDYLSLSNIIFNKEKEAANNDFDYMCDYLKKFDWTKCAKLSDSNTLSDTETQAINNVVTTAKLAKEVVITTLLNQLKVESKQHNEELVESNTIATALEKDIRYKVNVIAKYTNDSDNLSKSVDVFNAIGNSTQAWNQFNKSVNIQKLVTNSKFMTTNNATVKFITDIYSTFNVSTKYTSDEIHSFINSIMTKHFNTTMTKNKSIKLLNTFFGTKKASVRQNGKVVSKISILNNNPTNLNINTDKFYSEIEATKLAEQERFDATLMLF
tara:strand:- start:1617 stop:4472 length:2856 start_codon:yes stop_codon:yes gene_type:complete